MSQMIDKNQKISVDKKSGRVRVQTINSDASLTDQSGTDESDVNKIMAKYERTGQISHLAKRPGTFQDLSDIPDYQTMLAQMEKARDAFMTLPAKTRLRFENDPGQLVSFLQDIKNKDEAISLGLLPPPPKEQPTPSIVGDTKPQ